MRRNEEKEDSEDWILENDVEEALDAALIETVSKASRLLDSEQLRKLKSLVFELKNV